MLSFGQPLGWWALLGVPAVLAIHFLQRESRRVVVSTLFLLDQLAPESAAGRRVERLRHSVPLWLQLLAVLLLTWLLVQPRWLRRDSVQQVVVVLDASASMSAFRPELQQALAAITARLGRVAATTEWKLVESDPTRPPLYSGTDPERLREAAAAWQPHLGTHDFHPALAAAQTLLRGTGSLVLVSDRAAELPEGVDLVTIGHPLENRGFGGATFTGRHWRALVKNYGARGATRHWWTEAAGRKSAPMEITLAPGQSLLLEGELPAETDSMELVLEPDAFTWDDRLPLQLPHPKPLAIAAGSAEPPLAEFFQRLLGSLENTNPAPDPAADLRLAVYETAKPALPAAPAIVFLAPPATSDKPAPGEITAENDPLTEGLNWSGLRVTETPGVPPAAGDRGLVWQGERPLLFLRVVGGQPMLVINFDLRTANATRLPAFVLLLHRFAEQVRAAKVAPASGNFECHQLLAVAADPRHPAPTLAGAAPGPLRAPERPGFFTVRQGETALLQGAAWFADARESDFAAATSSEHLRAAERRLIERNSQSDFLTPVWLLALGVAMAASWTWGSSRRALPH